MITMDGDRLVDDYLRRLDRAAAHLQRSRRAELVAEIREHIESALRQEEAAGETAVRNVLERLGSPEEIVDAAEPPPESDETHHRRGALEIIALIALLVPVLGWAVGIVLVLASRAWSNRDKLVGGALLLVPVAIPFLLLVAGAESGEDQSPVPVGDQPVELPEAGGGGSGLRPIEIAVLVVGFLGGLPSAIYLAWRLHEGAASRPRT